MEFERVQGVDIPKIGLGTWQLQGNTCYRAVLSALELGYRHLDTAEIYDNESEVGRAIADSRVARSELFLVTKVWTDHLAYPAVLRAARGSLKRLGVDQIDLYLVHWPKASMPIADTMQAMNELVEGGQVLRLGVSNFNVEQFEAAQSASSVKLFTNQVPFAVGRVDTSMLEYCQQNEVLLTAYSPLDRGRPVRRRPQRNLHADPSLPSSRTTPISSSRSRIRSANSHCFAERSSCRTIASKSMNGLAACPAAGLSAS